MIDFKIVECIDDSNSYLTKGEKYYLLKEGKHWWNVLDNRKYNAMYRPKQFKKVKK